MVFTAVLFLVAAGIACAVGAALVGTVNLPVMVVAVLCGLLAASSVHMTMDWEKAVVMRFGKFNRTAGPGLVFTIPIVEFYSVRIDQRVIATYFGAEETLTADLVPLNVDAVIFWMVFSPQKAATEVEDYASAVYWIAQATLRKAIGRATIGEVAARRDQLDAELKEVLEEKLDGWGINVMDVEVRDIVVPKELQQAMAAEAIATREKNARMIMAEAEADISDMLKDASENYADDPEAMRLRTMHLAYESVKQSGGTLVIPSAFSEGFTGDPDAIAKAAAKSKINSFASAQPIKPQQGKVSSHAATMFLAMPQFTRLKLFDAPTPMMAAVEQWLVETGMPVIEATNSVITVEMEAATPWYFSSVTMSMATDLMMRLPPSSVPREMASEQRIISHRGKLVSPLVSMPKASAMPKSPMDMNFWPSCAPWRNDSAQAQMSCTMTHTWLARPRWAVANRNSTNLVTSMPSTKPATRENTMP